MAMSFLKPVVPVQPCIHGGGLLLCGGAYLLYKHTKRRREGFLPECKQPIKAQPHANTKKSEKKGTKQ